MRNDLERGQRETLRISRSPRALFSWRREIRHQVPGRLAESSRESADVPERDVALTQLDHADVGAVEAGAMSQLLLGQTESSPELADTRSKGGESSVLRQHAVEALL